VSERVQAGAHGATKEKKENYFFHLDDEKKKKKVFPFVLQTLRSQLTSTHH
jgi:hypothetical protein